MILSCSTALDPIDLEHTHALAYPVRGAAGIGTAATEATFLLLPMGVLSSVQGPCGVDGGRLHGNEVQARVMYGCPARPPAVQLLDVVMRLSY
jgi:hypothetical protein